MDIFEWWNYSGQNNLIWKPAFSSLVRRNSEKGPSRKRKEERIKKTEDKFEYLSAVSRWLGL